MTDQYIVPGMTDFLFRPWIEPMATRVIADWLFPLSRAWAAGLAAEGSLDRFMTELPVTRGIPLVADALRRLWTDASAYQETEAAWEEAFFGAADVGPAVLHALETERRNHAGRLMAGRRYFLPLRFWNEIPPVRWEIPAPETVETHHGARRADPASAFPAPSLPRVSQSRILPGAEADESWVRFASPGGSAGGTVWAHVWDPHGIEDPPTLIFLHGIGVEGEFYPLVNEGLLTRLRRHCRIVRVEALWHGRRRAPGYYGGEPVIGRGPLGLLDFFAVTVRELGALILWARSRSAGPVALGGISLGALSSQVTAVAARQWPADARPDFMLLIAPGGDFVRVSLQGSLTRRVGLPSVVSRLGWDEAAVARWRDLLQPPGPPGLDPARIVAAIGSADDLTHMDDARRLMRDWGVPEENLFISNHGHYGLGMDFIRGGSIDRLLSLLKAASPSTVAMAGTTGDVSVRAAGPPARPG